MVIKADLIGEFIHQEGYSLILGYFNYFFHKTFRILYPRYIDLYPNFAFANALYFLTIPDIMTKVQFIGIKYFLNVEFLSVDG